MGRQCRLPKPGMQGWTWKLEWPAVLPRCSGRTTRRCMESIGGMVYKGFFFGLKLSSWPPGHWVPHVLVMPLPPDLATLIDPSGVEVLEAGPSGTWTSIPGTYIDYQTNVVVSIWLFGPSYHCFQPLLHWSTIGNLAPLVLFIVIPLEYRITPGLVPGEGPWPPSLLSVGAHAEPMGC